QALGRQRRPRRRRGDLGHPRHPHARSVGLLSAHAPADGGLVNPPRRRSVRILFNVLAVVVFVASVFPVYWMVNSAFLPNSAIRDATPHFFPDQFTFDNFVRVVTEPSGSIEFLPALATSLIVTVAAVAFALAFAFLAALALSRFRFRSRSSLVVALLIAQMIPAEAMMVSIFRVLDGWQLLNTIVGLTAVYVAAVLPF